MAGSGKEVFGDFVVFSVGRIAKDWTGAINDGLVYASDATTLGDGEVVTFTLAIKKDEDGMRQAEMLLLLEGRAQALNMGEEFSRKIVEGINLLKPWEVEAFESFISGAACEEGYSLEDEKGKISVGEGGEIRLEGPEESQAAGSLVVNANLYRDCLGKIDLSLPYGFDWGDSEPEESEELCAVIWSPSPALVGRQIDEAEEYRTKFRNSLNLYKSIIERWQSIETEELAKVWSILIDGLPLDGYIWNHTNVARLARDILGDKSLYRRIIDDAKKMADSGMVDYVTMAICIGGELSDELDQNREEIRSLMEMAVDKASVASEDDICRLIEATASEHGGCRLGDVEFAKNAIARVLSRVEDSKLKAKIKRHAEKTLKNYL